jgi:hypothetical protein
MIDGLKSSEKNMKISLVTNEKCHFSGKEEKFLINLTNEEGHSINISREFLEIGLKILNAIDPKIQINPPITVHQNAPYVSIPLPPMNGQTHIEQQPTLPYNQTLAPPKIASRIVSSNSVDINKVNVFLKEVERQQKKYIDENDDKKAEGISNIAIQNAIKEKYREINKDHMAKALIKTIPGMTQELFEMTYERSVRDYDKNFVDED